MAWTAEDRRRYAPAIQEMVRQGMLVRLATTIDTIDPPATVGRPRDWSTLTMLGALWHLARDGCVWRRRPVGPGRPPHQSVWSRFTRRRAVLDRALAVLVAGRRRAAGRKRRPTAAIIDTRSVKTGPQRGPRGYDANKKVNGRKRVLMADVGGDPLGLRGVPADVQDRDALAALAPDLAAHPSRHRAWIDLGFAARRCGELLARHGIVRELVGTAGRRGFVVEPRRWKVEQTFGCLQRYRRLRVDDEMSNETSRHMTILASLFMTGMRLERMLQEA
jgi:putative transposase